jgi:hypothetical protein
VDAGPGLDGKVRIEFPQLRDDPRELARSPPLETEAVAACLQALSEGVRSADVHGLVRLAFIHLLFLPRLQNRLRVEDQWLWSYCTGQRSSRLVTEAPRFGK